MKKSNDDISKDLLYQFFDYCAETGKNTFRCSLCKFSSPNRSALQMHIRSIHKSDINANMNPKFEEKSDCGTGICKDFYGITVDIHKFWCKKCVHVYENASKAEKSSRLKPIKEKENAPKLCPECGKSVHNLQVG